MYGNYYAGDPLVSVIVPAYNAENYLEEALDSVACQSYERIEILIVDDGSTDSTRAIAQRFTERDARGVVFHQSNQGVGPARNLAIQHARGEFVAPIDADDLWHPEKIEKQVRCASAGADIGLVYAWTAKIDDDRNVLGYSSYDFEGDTYLDLICSNFIGNASAPLIRKACLEKVGGYNPNFKKANAQGCEDWDLYLRLAERFEFRVVPEILVCYRSSPDSMSGDYLAMERSYWAMMRELRARNPDLPDQVLRWSMSSFYSYLLGKSSSAGDFRATTRWLLRTARLDPLRLLSLRWHKMAAVCLIRLISRNVASALVAGKHPWRRQNGHVIRPGSTGWSPANGGSRHSTQRHPTLYERLRNREQLAYREGWLQSWRDRIALQRTNRGIQ